MSEKAYRAIRGLSILGLALAALVFAYSSRYEIGVAASEAAARAYRLDNWTGEVRYFFTSKYVETKPAN